LKATFSQLRDLRCDLELEDKGGVFGFLAIEFKLDGSIIQLLQTGLIEKVIKCTRKTEASGKTTPAACQPLGKEAEGEPFLEDWNYSAAVGMLLCLSSNSHPDIAFAVSQVACFSHSHRKSHGQALKRVIHYLIETSNQGICFEPRPEQGLDCCVDADFAGLFGCKDDQDPTSVKSRTGFVLTLFGCPVLWSSKLQTDITLTAEHVAFSMSMHELLPMQVLLQEIGTKLRLAHIQQSMVRSTAFEDDMSTMSLINVPKMSTQNKHLSLKCHFFQSQIDIDKGIVVKYIKTTEQRADTFTKVLAQTQFEIIRKLLMGW